MKGGVRKRLGEMEFDLAQPGKGYQEAEYWTRAIRMRYEIPEHIPNCQVRKYLETLAEKRRSRLSKGFKCRRLEVK